MSNQYIPKYLVSPADVHSELAKHILADGYQLVVDMDNSSGVNIIDAKTGKRFFDMFTCFASMPLGFNHPKVSNQEFEKYIGKIALNKPSNSDVYTIEKATFTRTLFETAAPKGFKYAFFIEGGALAIENALKVSFDWKVRKNFAKGYTEEKGSKVIHFKEAFHGRTGYTMSLTNTDPVKTNHFPKFDWPRIINPKITFPLEENLERIIETEDEAKRQILAAFDMYKDDIACIIIEPIQSEGGDNHFRNEFFQFLRKVADEQEAMLIFDEVQTGVGMTGTMWMSEQTSVLPDIIAFGKKMQVCGIMVNERVDEVESHVFKQSSRINSTWGGNLIDMVRATRFLEVIQEDNLLDNSKNVGSYLLSQIKSLESNYNDVVSNARGKGLLCAMDMPADIRKKFISNCFDEGLIILSCGSNAVRFRPSLAITKEEVNEGMELIQKALVKAIG